MANKSNAIIAPIDKKHPIMRILFKIVLFNQKGFFILISKTCSRSKKIIATIIPNKKKKFQKIYRIKC